VFFFLYRANRKKKTKAASAAPAKADPIPIPAATPSLMPLFDDAGLLVDGVGEVVVFEVAATGPDEVEVVNPVQDAIPPSPFAHTTLWFFEQPWSLALRTPQIVAAEGDTFWQGIVVSAITHQLVVAEGANVVNSGQSNTQ